ncbi:MAG: hypothetical protein IJQ16_03520, partial [Selenomonadaceae bacterium]|nr:hypothetical protein [Selenomonadaceae bacterium]
FPFDKEQYKERHLVECFFQKLKRYRRIATRFDKLSCRYLAFYSPRLYSHLVKIIIQHALVASYWNFCT